MESLDLRVLGDALLRIGARTPAEIAVSIVAQLIECKNQAQPTARPVAGCAVA